MRYIIFLPFLFLFFKSYSQVDTVRWVQQKENNQVRRYSSNVEIQNCPYCSNEKIIIVENYSSDSILVNRKVTIDESCIIGYFHSFYSNNTPKDKISYQIKQNDIKPDMNNCSKKDGEWITFNEEGDTLSYELWKAGKYKNELLKQDSSSIWDCVVLINGTEKKGMQSIQANEKFQLDLILKYKNNGQPQKLYELEAKIIRGNKVISTKVFKSKKELDDFDFYKWSKKVKSVRGDRIYLTVSNKKGLVYGYNIPFD